MYKAVLSTFCVDSSNSKEHVSFVVSFRKDSRCFSSRTNNDEEIIEVPLHCPCSTS
jgi:hypothetical protein